MWKNAPKQDISQNKLKVILKEKFQETVDRIVIIIYIGILSYIYIYI